MEENQKIDINLDDQGIVSDAMADSISRGGRYTGPAGFSRLVEYLRNITDKGAVTSLSLKDNRFEDDNAISLLEELPDLFPNLTSLAMSSCMDLGNHSYGHALRDFMKRMPQIEVVDFDYMYSGCNYWRRYLTAEEAAKIKIGDN